MKVEPGPQPSPHPPASPSESQRRKVNCWRPTRGEWKREAGRGMAVAHASWLGLGGYIGNLAPSAIAPGPRISLGFFPGTIPTPSRGRQSFCAARVGIPGCRVEGSKTCFDGDVPLMMDLMHGYRHRPRRCKIERREVRHCHRAWRGRRFVGRFSRFFFSFFFWLRHRQACGASIGGRRISRWIRDLESTPSPIVTRASRRSVAASSRAQTRQRPAMDGCYGSGQAGAQRQR